MKPARHPEFPQFRFKLGAMKKVRRQVAAHRSLHSLETTMALIYTMAGFAETIVAGISFAPPRTIKNTTAS